mmetsp:Transcript_1169/g.3714  ORF Transcript_1169/g.3714 Transcript_1169/m.3714 type:complete len:213 (-) Transcript_1169:146-784(-)
MRASSHLAITPRCLHACRSSHTSARQVLSHVMRAVNEAQVVPEAMLLKPSMVLPGLDASPGQSEPRSVCIRDSGPTLLRPRRPARRVRARERRHSHRKGAQADRPSRGAGGALPLGRHGRRGGDAEPAAAAARVPRRTVVALLLVRARAAGRRAQGLVGPGGERAGGAGASARARARQRTGAAGGVGRSAPHPLLGRALGGPHPLAEAFLLI